MPSRDPHADLPVGHTRSLPMGTVSSILSTLGLALMTFLLARTAIEGSPELESEQGPACRTELAWRNYPIFALAWSPDGRRLVASGWGPRVRLWDLETGSSRFFDSEDGSPRFVLGWTSEGRGFSVSDLEGRVDSWGSVKGDRPAGEEEPRAARDGRAIARASRGASIRLWNLPDGRAELLPIPGRPANAFAYSPDARTIASAGRDGVVRLFEVDSGRLRLSTPVIGGGINVVAFSPDGKWLAAGGGGPLRVWEVDSGREQVRLGSPTGGFSALTFSPDGRRLAAASWKGDLRIWDLKTGRMQATLGGSVGHVLTMAWSPDGRRLASAGHGATVRVWDVGDLR